VVVWPYLAPIASTVVVGGVAGTIRFALRERTARRLLERAFDAYLIALRRGHNPDLVALTKARGQGGDASSDDEPSAVQGPVSQAPGLPGRLSAPPSAPGGQMALTGRPEPAARRRAGSRGRR
jgi:hypothetical protein